MGGTIRTDRDPSSVLASRLTRPDRRPGGMTKKPG